MHWWTGSHGNKLSSLVSRYTFKSGQREVSQTHTYTHEPNPKDNGNHLFCTHVQTYNLWKDGGKVPQEAKPSSVVKIQLYSKHRLEEVGVEATGKITRLGQSVLPFSQVPKPSGAKLPSRLPLPPPPLPILRPLLFHFLQGNSQK